MYGILVMFLLQSMQEGTDNTGTGTVYSLSVSTEWQVHGEHSVWVGLTYHEVGRMYQQQPRDICHHCTHQSWGCTHLQA